jgi:tetratricopeptide (TPR) repeat protein
VFRGAERLERGLNGGSLDHLLDAYLAADRVEAPEMLDRYPELLSDDCLALVGGRIDAADARSDTDEVVALDQQRALLERCREIGIESAFEEWDASVDAAFEEFTSLVGGATVDWDVVATAQAEELYHTYRSTRSRAALDQMVDLYESAAGQAGSAPPETDARMRLPTRLIMLGGARRFRFEQLGDLDDLGRAVDAHEQAAATATPGPRPVDSLSELALDQLSGYDRTGDPGYLEQALDAWERAVDATLPGSRDRAWCLTGLGATLTRRFERGGDLEDFERALDLCERGVAEDAERRLGSLNSLANCLLARPRPSNFERALRIWRQAIDELPAESSLRHGFLNNLGNALIASFIVTSELARLDEAIEAFENAADAAPDEGGDRLGHLLNVAHGLRLRAEHDDGAADIDRAVTMGETLLSELPSDSPQRHRFLGSLAESLYIRGVMGDSREDLERATGLYRECLPQALEMEVELAIESAYNWGRRALGRESWAEAVEAFDFGFAATERLVRAQLLRGQRAEAFARVYWLAGGAALALTNLGELERAAQTLERGGALLLGEALERDRAAVDELAEVGRADLRDGYRAAVARLDAAEDAALVLEPAADGGDADAAASRTSLRVELRNARADLDAVVAAIQAVEGFRGFLAPTQIDEPRAAAAAAPLTYLVPTDVGGLAIVVRPDASISSVPLPSLTRDHLSEVLHTYLGAYENRRESPAAWRAALDQTTRWLWNAAMGSLLQLDSLGPRLTLVPLGALGLLPLHAAWTPDPTTPTGRRYALDELLITFAPNARALLAADEIAGAVSADGLLAVQDPQPVSAPALEHAASEIAAAANLFPTEQTLELSGRFATRDAVLTALPEYRVLHFACHGRIQPSAPLGSALLLADDEKLTLRDILEARLRARLAVLSACDTAFPDAQAPDEAIGFPSALVEAGVAGVIGSLWSVSNVSTAVLLTRFYELWGGEEKLDPPEALRRAQLWLRDAPNREKRDRFPEFAELQGADVPARAKRLWEEAHGHASPYHWAGFVYVGV